MATLGESGSLRLVVFFGILIAMLILETIIPRRKHARDSLTRLSTNGLLTVLNGFVMALAAKAIVPIAAVAAAVFVGEKGWGLFNILSLDPTLEIVLSLILLDLAIYVSMWPRIMCRCSGSFIKYTIRMSSLT